VKIVHSSEVSVSRLDDFAFSPKLIKADVEGEEVNLLRGAWTTLADARPLVLVEFDRQASGEAAAIALLEQLPKIGYGTFDFFGEPLRLNDWDAWNILLYPTPNLPAAIRDTMRQAGSEYFRNRRGWNPYQKLSGA
jgi:hypothetical protein